MGRCFDLLVAFDEMVRDVARVKPHHESVEDVWVDIFELEPGVADAFVGRRALLLQHLIEIGRASPEKLAMTTE